MRRIRLLSLTTQPAHRPSDHVSERQRKGSASRVMKARHAHEGEREKESAVGERSGGSEGWSVLYVAKARKERQT